MLAIFRVDASLQIGTGHVMRCLTLAGALRERGARCRFVCREEPGNLIALIREQGFEAIPLPGNDGKDIDWEADAALTQKVDGGGTAADWLIVDHYALDARWERTLRPHCHKLMVIDDLADRPHDCDLLLDQNLVANLDDRYSGKVPTTCCLRLGPTYVLMQPAYRQLRSQALPRSGPVKRLLIYFGGADAGNLTGLALTAFACLKRPDIALDVVINPASPHAASLRRQVADLHLATLHEQLPSLAPLILRADLAIGAGGTSTWERCCLGLPSLVITLAENQRAIASEMNGRGLIRWLGHQGAVDANTLAGALREIIDSGLTPDWSQRCANLVDGKGSERIADILMPAAHKPLLARPATWADEQWLLRLSNDPLVRRNSFSPETIHPDIHHAWLEKRLGEPGLCRLYVVETPHADPVGQVRFEKCGMAWELHYALDACFRGRGMGAGFLEAAISAFAGSLSEACEIVARVKPENPASRNVFDKLGFTQTMEEDQYIYRRIVGRPP